MNIKASKRGLKKDKYESIITFIVVLAFSKCNDPLHQKSFKCVIKFEINA